MSPRGYSYPDSRRSSIQIDSSACRDQTSRPSHSSTIRKLADEDLDLSVQVRLRQGLAALHYLPNRTPRPASACICGDTASAS